MKKYLYGALLVAAAFAGCKKNSVTPVANSLQAQLAGSWKWSAEYIYSPGDPVQTPANTGNQETLKLNTDWTWTQEVNGQVANSGTWSLPKMATLAFNSPPITLLQLANSRVTDTAKFDNFNFNTGFAGSYYTNKDSLVMIGVNVVGTNSFLAERVYLK